MIATGEISVVVRRFAIMKILIVGHRGYIGPVVANHFASIDGDFEIHGIDSNWFKGSEAIAFPEAAFSSETKGDTRDLSASDLSGYDAVVQLAAVSNDPIGKEFENATMGINAEAAIATAKLAKEAGVKRFVFASSCSMYGAGSDSLRKETDTLNPLTAYARSKVATEEGLRGMATDDFMVTSLRFSTACGASPMLRLDLVLNDFVATALRTGKIEVLSDGSPWRPLIHVEDMARAIEWACTRDGDKHVEVNVGSQNWTWQIGQLAKDVGDVLGGVEVEINTDAQPDNRSYRVDFSKFEQLAPNHQPQKDFAEAVHDLAVQVKAMDFAGTDVRGSNFIRLNILRGLVEDEKLDKE